MLVLFQNCHVDAKVVVMILSMLPQPPLCWACRIGSLCSFLFSGHFVYQSLTQSLGATVVHVIKHFP